MEIDSLTVAPRSETGKGPNRRLRVAGQVPAVVYGLGNEPIMVTLNYRQLEKALSKANAETNLFNLEGDVVGKDVTTIMREIQRDPLTRRYLHVDLLRVAMDQESEFEVPIHSDGTPIGVREGGIMETHLRSIVIRCLPRDLPEEIRVDISKLAANTSFHVKDVTLPANATLVTPEDETLFTVHAKRAAVEEEAAEGEAAPAEPEVVGKPEEKPES